jgi:hypothetical protein
MYFSNSISNLSSPVPQSRTKSLAINLRGF